mgnify:CR=1 FL=1
MSRAPAIDLEATLAALADPTRRAILSRLADGEATVTELCAPFDLTQPAISFHLKVLERAGLIARRTDGARRPCRLVEGALAPLDDYLRPLRAAMERNYERLDALLVEMGEGDVQAPRATPARKKTPKSRERARRRRRPARRAEKAPTKET